MLLCVWAVIDHGRLGKNISHTLGCISCKWRLAAPRVSLYYSYHILTSSAIYFLNGTRQHGILLRLLPTFAGVLRRNIRTRASFPKILANYISEESLINAVYNENMIEVTFPLRMSQEPVRRETTEGSCIEFIGYRMLQHEQNSCTLFFTRHQSGFFDIPIGWVDIGI